MALKNKKVATSMPEILTYFQKMENRWDQINMSRPKTQLQIYSGETVWKI